MMNRFKSIQKHLTEEEKYYFDKESGLERYKLSAILHGLLYGGLALVLYLAEFYAAAVIFIVLLNLVLVSDLIHFHNRCNVLRDRLIINSLMDSKKRGKNK